MPPGERLPLHLEGSLADNLRAAIASATRLKDHPVHRDTLQFWGELLTHARLVHRRGRVRDLVELERLIIELELSLYAHIKSL